MRDSRMAKQHSLNSQPPTSPPWRPTPAWHAALSIPTELLGFLGGFFVAYAFLKLAAPINLGNFGFLVLGCFAFVGVFAVRQGLTKHWPARCPHCRGPAYLFDVKPWTYQCRVCHQLTATRLRSNL